MRRKVKQEESDLSLVTWQKVLLGINPGLDGSRTTLNTTLPCLLSQCLSFSLLLVACHALSSHE